MPPFCSRSLWMAFACLAASSAAGQELAAPLASAPWLVTGNSVGSADFVGTRNNAPLVFKSDGREAMRILSTLDIGIGTTVPTSPLTVKAATSAKPVLSVTQTSAHSGSDAISGVTYGAASVGVYAEGAGKNGYGVYAFTNGPGGTALLGYNHATGNAGYFLIDGANPSPNADDTGPGNAALYAVNSAGSASLSGFFGPAAAFVVNGANNESPAVFAQAATGPGVEAESADDIGVFARTTGVGFGVYAVGGANGTAATVLDGASGAGYCYFAGGPGWNCTAVAALRKHAEAVDPNDVLRKLAALPLSYYRMAGARDPGVRYLGPNGEDFKAAFGLGADDATINTADAQGVAFAAIQGLYRELQAKAGEIAALKAANAALRAEISTRLAALETRLGPRSARPLAGRGGGMASFHQP